MNKPPIFGIFQIQFNKSANIFKYPYQNGYIGAFLEKGLSNTFILELTHNLKTTFQKIFKNLNLTEAWIYKYDSDYDGINVHADEAKVNVNFWITPEESNLNSKNGGLIIWDKFPKKDSGFEDYNYIKNSSDIEKMLNENNAKEISNMLLFNQQAIAGRAFADTQATYPTTNLTIDFANNVNKAA